jgi:hypothetical protein
MRRHLDPDQIGKPVIEIKRFEIRERSRAVDHPIGREFRLDCAAVRFVPDELNSPREIVKEAEFG